MTTNAGNKRGLGRGLGALIVNTENNPATPEVIAQADAGGVRLVNVAAIRPNPHQPRATFDQDALAELAASIHAHGIIQPLIVSISRDGAGGPMLDADGQPRYWLVAGERRWRASRLAGLTEVPVIVRDASPQQLMEWALVENIQRSDLNPFEEATAYHSLMEVFQMTQAEVATRVGKSRSAVANTVRLLQLPPTVQAAVIKGQISAGHARALLALPDGQAMEAVLAAIIKMGLNVRQTEDLVKRHLAEPDSAQDAGPDEAEVDPQLQVQVHNLENRLRSVLGTKVNLNRNADGSGRLVIHFYNEDDLNHLVQQVVGDDEP